MANIWTFSENESVDVMAIDINKTFKPTGKFYDDVDTLMRLFSIKAHPALKRPVAPSQEEEKKEQNTLTFYKHRLDRGTVRTLFTCLPSSP